MDHSLEAKSNPYWESPPYKVIQTYENGIEERHYPAKPWIVHEEIIEGGKLMKREYDLFWPIFSYMTGKNSKGQKIQMTIPTSTRVEQIDNKKFKYQTGYYLPEEFHQDPPIPHDDKVQIVVRDLHIFALVFPGYAREKDFSKKASELIEFLRNNDTSFAMNLLERNLTRGHHVHYNVVNCPAKCWGKRNEVWVPAEHYARLYDRSNSDPNIKWK